jgi:hypothetical protein
MYIPLKRSVLTVTFHARKCSRLFVGLMVFKKRARKAILYLTFNQCMSHPTGAKSLGYDDVYLIKKITTKVVTKSNFYTNM